MRKSKAEYQKKCKIKTVTFYTNKEDQELYEFANTINFQKFVKQQLKAFINSRKHISKTLAYLVHDFFRKDGGNNGDIQN